MIGIYKITNPKGKVYIGQSVNIQERWNAYQKGWCKNQVKLFNSFNKYGVINHIFEIIEECDFDKLNIKERYWQEFYDVLGELGLNCKLVNSEYKKCEVSQETKSKIGKAHLGKVTGFKETRKGKGNPMFGKKHSEESKQKMKNSSSRVAHFKNHKHSDEAKRKISESRISEKHHRSRKVEDIITGKIFNTVTEAAKSIGINRGYLSNMLLGKSKNKTNFKFYGKIQIS